MVKGTTSFGKHGKRNIHIKCRRCGRRGYHVNKKRCSACGYGESSRINKSSWRTKNVNRARFH